MRRHDAAEDDDQARRVGGKGTHRFDGGNSRFVALPPPCSFEHIGKDGAILDDNERPGVELAMIGNPRRDPEQPLDLSRCRTRKAKVARLPRTARREQAERGRAVVEHALRG